MEAKGLASPFQSNRQRAVGRPRSWRLLTPPRAGKSTSKILPGEGKEPGAASFTVES